MERPPQFFMVSRIPTELTSSSSSTNATNSSNPQASLKAPFPHRLAKGKKGKSTVEILDIFKKVSVNIHLLDAIK